MTDLNFEKIIFLFFEMSEKRMKMVFYVNSLVVNDASKI